MIELPSSEERYQSLLDMAKKENDRFKKANSQYSAYGGKKTTPEMEARRAKVAELYNSGVKTRQISETINANLNTVANDIRLLRTSGEIQ